MLARALWRFVFVAALIISSPAQTQTPISFEGKTISFVVGFPAGGGTDASARAIAPFLTKYLPGNPPVVVSNMPGADGMTAMNTFVQPQRTPADGTAITYQNYPPSSGTHYPRWVRYGIFTEIIPEGYWVHNLEHGTIVFLYKCTTDCAAKASQIRPIYERLPRSKHGEIKFLATPYERMQKNYATVAWEWVDEMDDLDAARIERFYRAFVDRGPEDVP